MKQITLNIEQMNHLKELGLDTSDASMCWNSNGMDYGFQLLLNDSIYYHSTYEIYPAYTLQDIVNKLPQGNINNQTNELIITHNYTAYKGYTVGGYNCPHIEYGDPLTSTYNMLLWCIENGYVKTN